MTQEEKAKAYDEAIGRAKSKIKNDKDHVLYEDDIIELFPELAESEDEVIRKELIVEVKEQIDWISAPDRRREKDKKALKKLNKWLAWLEKQGKQKEINLVEILKHYPRETELYSPLYGKLWLAEIDEECRNISCGIKTNSASGKDVWLSCVFSISILTKEMSLLICYVLHLDIDCCGDLREASYST